MRIFLKLFFSFWATVVLTGAMVAWAGHNLHQEVEESIHLEMERLRPVIESLAEKLTTEGEDPFRRAFDHHPDRDLILVFDGGNRELFGRELFPRFPQKRQAPVEATVEETLEEDVFAWVPSFHPLIRAATPEGETFTILPQFMRPPFISVLAHNPQWVAAILGVSALLVFFQALLFSIPIQRLRESAHLLAGGDLAARARPVHRLIGDELAELHGDFNHMADRLQRLFFAHHRLLRDVSHELRSPLTRMRAALGLLERETPGTNVHLERLEREVERLDELIGHILAVSRPEGVTAARQESWVDLGALVGTVALDVDFEAGQSGRRLTVQNRDGILLQADPLRMRSAVENVVRNALRHTRDEGAVLLALAQEGGMALIRIADEGAGVAEENLERIFEPFFRVEEARDRESGGFGLGLAIAARVVRDLGGDIKAANRPEGGLEVTIRLPMAEGFDADLDEA